MDDHEFASFCVSEQLFFVWKFVLYIFEHLLFLDETYVVIGLDFGNYCELEDLNGDGGDDDDGDGNGNGD